MRRYQLFEFEDLEWFPATLRDACTAFLRLTDEMSGQPQAFGRLVTQVLDESGEGEILDICSGGGGPAIAIGHAMTRLGRDCPVTLTDLFPSAAARARFDDLNERVKYLPTPVDATDVPAERPGLRTIFNAFHHFRPDTATRVLASAVAANRPILVMEVLQRRISALLIATALLPLVVLVFVPLLRPLRLSWFLLTYLLPVIPLFIWWDGIVSVLRLYSRDELLAMAHTADPKKTFIWWVEEVQVRGPIHSLAFIGMPNNASHFTSRSAPKVKAGVSGTVQPG